MSVLSVILSAAKNLRLIAADVAARYRFQADFRLRAAPRAAGDTKMADFVLPAVPEHRWGNKNRRFCVRSSSLATIEN